MRLNDNAQMALLGIGSVLFVLLGCTKKVDEKKLHDLIEEICEDQLDLKVKDIDCPKEIKVEEGKTFECTAKVKPKGKIVFKVEITDSSGSIHASTKYDVLNPDNLEDDIEGKLSARGIKAKLNCGKKVRVAKPDSSFKCKVKGDSRKVKVSVDEDGAVTWKLD